MHYGGPREKGEATRKKMTGCLGGFPKFSCGSVVASKPARMRCLRSASGFPASRKECEKISWQTRETNDCSFVQIAMFYDQSDDPAADEGDLFRLRPSVVQDCPEGAFPAPSVPASDPDSPRGHAGDPRTRTRGGYDREVIENVWEFAEIVNGVDPALWRKDEFGDWIHRLDYGRRDSAYGWELFDPGAGRRPHGVYAMRPMQWQSYVRQYEAFA
jgi:hypothetical protein